MKLLGFDDDDRVFVAIPAVVLGLMTVLVLGVALGRVTAGSGSAAVDPAVPRASRDAAAAQGGCQVAVEQARAALDAARAVDAALTTHTEVFIDLRAQRLTTEQALARSAPALTDGARQSVQLDVATQRFLQLAHDCQR